MRHRIQIGRDNGSGGRSSPCSGLQLDHITTWTLQYTTIFIGFVPALSPLHHDYHSWLIPRMSDGGVIRHLHQIWPSTSRQPNQDFTRLQVSWRAETFDGYHQLPGVSPRIPKHLLPSLPIGERPFPTMGSSGFGISDSPSGPGSTTSRSVLFAYIGLALLLS